MTPSEYQPAPDSPVQHFHDPVDMDDFERILQRFNARHPVEVDVGKERRIDAILLRVKTERLRERQR